MGYLPVSVLWTQFNTLVGKWRVGRLGLGVYWLNMEVCWLNPKVSWLNFKVSWLNFGICWLNLTFTGFSGYFPFGMVLDSKERGQQGLS
jgi:hypothetical protein